MKKKKFVVMLLAIIAGTIFLDVENNEVLSYSAGAPNGHANDPYGGNKTCNTSGCHTGASVSIGGLITSNIPAAGYTPNTTYTITATIVAAGHSKFGFQISPQDSSGTPFGTMTSISSQTSLFGGSVILPKYISHSSSGNSGAGSKTWNFRWTSPAAGFGAGTFYGTFNVANSNFTNTGDSIYTSTLLLQEVNATGQSDFKSKDQKISIFPNPVAETLNIQYHVQNPGQVTISIIDLQGRLIENLLSEQNMPGAHQRSFDIKNRCLPGIYFIQITIDEQTTIKKILIR